MRTLPVLIFTNGGKTVPIASHITLYFFISSQKLEQTNALFISKNPSLSLICPVNISAFTGHYEGVSSN